MISSMIHFRFKKQLSYHPKLICFWICSLRCKNPGIAGQVPKLLTHLGTLDKYSWTNTLTLKIRVRIKTHAMFSLILTGIVDWNIWKFETLGIHKFDTKNWHQVMDCKGEPLKVERSCLLWIPTLPETNSSPLRIDPWKPGDSYWKPSFFRGYVRFKEGKVYRFSDKSVCWIPVFVACAKWFFHGVFLTRNCNHWNIQRNLDTWWRFHGANDAFLTLRCVRVYAYHHISL